MLKPPARLVSVEDMNRAIRKREREDVLQALTYAAWRSEEQDFPLVSC